MAEGAAAGFKIGRGASIPSFLAMDVIAEARRYEALLPQGAPPVIHMEVGQPGTGAPPGAVAAAQAALAGGLPLGYTEAFGLPVLRERIARHYAEIYGVAVPPSRICVTTGASGGFVLAFLAAFDPGGRVALAAPYYPPYVNILTALGMRPVVLPCDAATRFQPTVAMLEALDPRPDGLILASPCKPAGTMLPPDELAAIVAWCEANGVRLVSDEIYHGLQYGLPAATAAASAHTVVVNSFSKYWSMTGWRVGWLVLPEDLARPVERLAQNLFISAPHIAQLAAAAAMECRHALEENVARYRRVRDDLLHRLPQAGLDRLSTAEGAFYLYADIGDLAPDSLAFCRRLLTEAQIAATPGIDFDPDRGGRFARFSYCGPEDQMRAVPERIARMLRS